MTEQLHTQTKSEPIGDAQRRPSSKSPQRFGTDPTGKEVKRINKRIIVCCDGTWQDGISQSRRKYTNVLRLARTIDQEDVRTTPPTPQIVYYQSGIGSENNLYSEYIEGTTGASLADKVEEAYAFVAHNYFPGDEIFLFGFSRGAYTARMVAMLIGAIGLLDRRGMNHFGKLFIAYQKLGKAESEEEKKQIKKVLDHYEEEIRNSVQRSFPNNRPFSVKCVGVFDTVGSLGLPEELLCFKDDGPLKTLFGFPDRILGEHVERAYQALALDEPRKDFDCTRFEQSTLGRSKGQVLEQCWFSGSHGDVGGGYSKHDLTDITLAWMVAHVADILSVDFGYLAEIPKPNAPWGALKPHDPITGIFSLALTTQRTLPSSLNQTTHERIHSSVLQQQALNPAVKKLLDKHPELVAQLLPLEEQFKASWSYIPGRGDDQEENVFLSGQLEEDTLGNRMVFHAWKMVIEGMDSVDIDG